MKKFALVLMLSAISFSAFAAGPARTAFGFKLKAQKEKKVRNPASADSVGTTIQSLNHPAFKAFTKQAMGLKFTADSLEYASDEMKRMGVAGFFKNILMDTAMDGYKVDKTLNAGCETSGNVKKCMISVFILAENTTPNSEDPFYEGSTIFQFDMNSKGAITGAVKMMQAE